MIDLVKISMYTMLCILTLLNSASFAYGSNKFFSLQDGCSGGGDGGCEVASRSGEDITHDSGDMVEVLSNLGIVGVVSSMIGSAVRHLSGDDDMTDAQLEVPQQERREEEREARFETALSHQFV